MAYIVMAYIVMVIRVDMHINGTCAASVSSHVHAPFHVCTLVDAQQFVLDEGGKPRPLRTLWLISS